MSQTIYGSPSDDWVSRTTSIRDGKVCVDVVMKGVIDGIADGLGLKNDRDPRVVWHLAQRRGAPKEYAVEVLITEASHA